MIGFGLSASEAWGVVAKIILAGGMDAPAMPVSEIRENFARLSALGAALAGARTDGQAKADEPADSEDAQGAEVDLLAQQARRLDLQRLEELAAGTDRAKAAIDSVRAMHAAEPAFDRARKINGIGEAKDGERLFFIGHRIVARMTAEQFAACGDLMMVAFVSQGGLKLGHVLDELERQAREQDRRQEVEEIRRASEHLPATLYLLRRTADWFKSLEATGGIHNPTTRRLLDDIRRTLAEFDAPANKTETPAHG